MKSSLDLINECDKFPYAPSPLHTLTISKLYTLHLSSDPTVPLGYLTTRTINDLPWPSYWMIDHTSHTLTLTLPSPLTSTPAKTSALIAETTSLARKCGTFELLKGWRNELFPVYGRSGELLFSIERSAAPLFGVVTYGVHMTAYVAGSANESGSAPRLRIWVPRRSATKQTYPSMLDNSVAGGISISASGVVESPFETMVRESEEEASLPPALVRGLARAVGVVTYFHLRDSRAGGETGLPMPENQFVYDLPLPEDVIPKPGDGEAEGFELMDVDEVKLRMGKGEFKPNCALVLVDFLVRHGKIVPEGERSYLEIVRRLHRRLEFPIMGGTWP
ncbi:MAG: hypothetical protein M1834_001567 [Cirrosporium novae-zelandiae]|nr:MAG: hypothetical protein M1834_004084 [Cirrosporium novae-zelandiae]KAI9735552.1 MAG: hypothetical protein M1834_001567 [Cirrosporium novae-zelandiae]